MLHVQAAACLVVIRGQKNWMLVPKGTELRGLAVKCKEDKYQRGDTALNTNAKTQPTKQVHSKNQNDTAIIQPHQKGMESNLGSINVT